MRRKLFLVLLATVIAGSMLSAAPSAQGAVLPPLKCSTKTVAGKAVRFCKGLVLSKDRSVKLDVDVTLPPTGSRLPLIVMLHGLGGSKLAFEAKHPGVDVSCTTVPSVCTLADIAGTGDRFHMNNLWFARRGYAVLTYTARGHSGVAANPSELCVSDAPSADYSEDLYPSPPNAPSPACLAQIPHRKHEVEDAQWLISRLVDGTLMPLRVSIDPNRVGVGGVSYGGGTSWLLTRRNTWRTPRGTMVRLAAAVPAMGWSDLVEALMPQGRAPDVVPPTDIESRLAQRVGVLKQSYAQGFYDALEFYSHRDKDYNVNHRVPGYLTKWLETVKAGEPYDEAEKAPFVRDAITKLLVNRSAYYVGRSRPLHVTPTLGVQGWTDEIFPASQLLNMYHRLQGPRIDSGEPPYPLKLYIGDWGHPRAQHKQAENEYIAGLANKWFDYYLRGKGTRPLPHVEARTTICSDRSSAGGDPGALYRAARWSRLQAGALEADLPISGTLNTPAADPHAQALEPTQRGLGTNPRTCRSTDTAVAPDNAAASIQIDQSFTMLGMPRVSLLADPSQAGMYISARLWDVDPSASDPAKAQTLVDRGVYRLGTDGTQIAVFQLNGNAYEFQPGHELKLELTADDSPTFRRFGPTGDTAVHSIQISNVSLSVPRANEDRLVP